MAIHQHSRRVFLAGACGALTAASPPLAPGMLAGALGLATGLAHGQSASSPLHILCSGPGGSIPDNIARGVAGQLGARQASGAVVDNRPGAAGQLAVSALQRGSADGTSILLAQGAIATIYPYLYAKLAYDPAVDLLPVSLAAEMTMALAIGPAVPPSVTDVRSLLAWMRREPKLANVGSPGTGTLPHLLEAMLFREAGVPWQHVAYSGGPPGIVALLGANIAAMVLPEGLFSQHRTAGRLRVLATSDTHRTRLLPDVPTFAEQGFADLVVREWFGFFMPGRASRAVAQSSSSALQQALAQPALVAAFNDAGMQATSSTPQAMASRIAIEQRTWQPIMRTLGVQVQ